MGGWSERVSRVGDSVGCAWPSMGRIRRRLFLPAVAWVEQSTDSGNGNGEWACCCSEMLTLSLCDRCPVFAS